MSLQFISNSVLRGDASFSTGSAALFQSSGNNTTSDTWIYNSGSLANGYQLDFGHGIVRTSANIIMTLKDENVGIGTTSPTTKLQISADNASSPTANIFLDIDGNNQPGMGGQIMFGTSTSGSITQYIATIQGVRSASDDGSSDIHFQTTHVATAIAPSTKMTILSGGKVGIETTSPNRTLHVIGQVAIDNSTSPSGGLLVSPDGASNKVYSRTGNATSTAHPLDFISGSSTSMTIDSNGNVGIGTTSPLYKLHVDGQVKIQSTNYEMLYLHQADANGGFIKFTNTDDTSGWYTGIAGTEKFIISRTADNSVPIITVEHNGNVGIATDIPSQPLEVHSTIKIGESGVTGGRLISADSMIFQIDSDNTSGSSSYRFRTNGTADDGTELMRIQENGNVGIGTTSPLRRLDVDSAAASDIARFGNTSGNFTLGQTTALTSLDLAASNAYRIRQGSTTPFYIKSDGKVGIGTTSPLKTLSVNGGDIAVNNGNSFIVGAAITGNTQIGELGADAGQLQLLTESTRDIKFGSTTYGNIMFLEGTNGSVGIGTDSPTAKLTISSDVGGDGTWVNSGILIENSASSAECAVVWKNAETGSNYWFTGLNQSNIYRIAYGTGFVNTNSFLQINNTGTLTLDGYDLANKTGTPTYMLGTDADGNVVKVLGGDIPGGGGTVTGSGTAEYIPKWNSTSALVNSKAFQSTASSITTFNIGTESTTCDFLNYQDTTGAISGKVPIIQAKAALIGIGAQDKTYTTIYEGIKIIPATSHYLTRITPRLEVYPYEDPSTTTDNTYDSSFVGSCFSMGSQNTIGNSTSSNLGIFGFNNTITGDKFVIIGQGNVLGKANVSSLAVGTTNTISGNGKLVNSLLVGQNMTLTQPATRSIVAGINHSFQGAMNNTVIVGSGNQGFGSNNFIWGSSNQGSGVNNIMLGGFSGQITSSSGNLYGSALMGWNNTLQTSPRATFVTGRDNIVIDTDYSIIGGFNNDTSAYHSSLLVGTKNYGRGVGNIIGGESNTVENNSSSYNLIGGFKNTVSSTSNLVVGTSNTVKSTTKGNIVGGNNNNIDVAANENNIISGVGNDIFVGSDNIVIGNQINVGILSNTSSKIARSIIVGQNHSVGTFSSSGVAAKSNMAIFGSSNSARGNNTFVAGANNSGFADNAIVLGNGNSSGGVASGENKVIQIGFSIQPNSQSDYLAIGYGMSALPTTAVDNNNVANKYTAIGRNPDNNVDYDLSSLDPVSFIVGAGTQQNYRRTAIAVTCKNSSSGESNVILPGVGKYRNYTNDTTAAAGGVPLYGLYHTSGTIKIRIA